MSAADFFFKINFSNNSIRNTIRVPNSLAPDQVGHFVGAYLGLNCLQTILAGKELLGKDFVHDKIGLNNQTIVFETMKSIKNS